MQTHGYLLISGEKILVLMRVSGWKRYLKIRTSGSDGAFFESESGHIEDLESLNTAVGYISDLKAGKTIQIE